MLKFEKPFKNYISLKVFAFAESTSKCWKHIDFKCIPTNCFDSKYL